MHKIDINRIYDVFFFEDNEEVVDASFDEETKQLTVNIVEYPDKASEYDFTVSFDYKPNMDCRPEALDYILCRRNCFND